MIRKNELESELVETAKKLESLVHHSYILKETMEKEERDVRELEGRSFAAWMGRLSGKLESQIEKETLEFSAAHSSYEKNARESNNVAHAIEMIRMEVEACQGAEDTFAELIERKRTILASLQAETAELLEKEVKISQLENLILLLDECRQSAEEAKAVAAQFNDSIGAAAAWKEVTYYSVLGWTKDCGINSVLEKISLLHESVGQYKQLLDKVPGITSFPEMRLVLDDLKNLDSKSVEEVLEYDMEGRREYEGIAADKIKALHLKLYTSVKVLDEMLVSLKTEMDHQKKEWQKLVMNV